MLSSCVTILDTIRGSSPAPQQGLVRVMNAPQLYVGREARFDGKVVDIQNRQGKSRLEIATILLDSGAHPVLGETFRGRTYVDVNGFPDPVDFRGQLVTIVSPISGAVDEGTSSAPHRFMLVRVTGYRRWHVTRRIVVPPQPIDPWFCDAHDWPYGGYSGWGWYNPGPAQVQTIVTE